MKIIGGRDYYDSALAYGRDDDVVYVRKGYDLPVVKASTLSYNKLNIGYKDGKYHGGQYIIKGNQYFFTFVCVYFCGKKYNGVKVSANSDLIFRPSFFWNATDLKAFLDILGLEVKRWKPYSWTKAKDCASCDLNEFFDIQATPKEVNYLIDNRIVSAILETNFDIHYLNLNKKDDYVWEVNSDNLKRIEFFKRVDPYTAFQEISMWMGVLPKSGNPMVEITDDKVKAHKAGFDKWSFRKVGKKGM